MRWPALFLAAGLFQQGHLQDPARCPPCSAAYKKAKGYVLGKFGQTRQIAAKVATGFLLLADGGHPRELQACIDACKAARCEGVDGNWFIGMAGLFLSEVYKFRPSADVAEALDRICREAAANVSDTGGWLHSKNFKEAMGAGFYSPDIAILTAMFFSTFWNMKSCGLKVDEALLSRAEANLSKLAGSTGFGYGTGNKTPDRAGTRGAFALLGLASAGQTQHKFYQLVHKALPGCLPSLEQGHAFGGLHILGAVLGCHALGPQTYQKLTAEWLDKLIRRQEEDGSLQIGSDGKSNSGGGVKEYEGLNRHMSTAGFALMIALQDPNCLRSSKQGPKKGEKKPSPFSRPKPK